MLKIEEQLKIRFRSREGFCLASLTDAPIARVRMSTYRDIALHILNSIEHQGRREHRVYLPMVGNVPSEFGSTIIHLDVQLASELGIFLLQRSSYRLLDLLVGDGRSESKVILDLSLGDRLRCP